MKNSTTFASQWYGAHAALTVVAVPADMAVDDAWYAEEYVTVVQPEELGLLWPVRLTVERDEGWFIASDDFSEVYGEGETRDEAITTYRSALSALHRVLSVRQETLSPDLMKKLAILRSVVPPGE